MSTAPFDLTIVLNGHHEGALIHRSLRSVVRSIEYAVVRGLRCELLVILDRPDLATKDYFSRVEDGPFRVLEVEFGDPALARNAGVEHASGAYVAFVDGDDLISANWLAAAFEFAEQHRHSGRQLVLHPEFSLFFGADCSILTHIDQDSPDWSLGSLFAANYWTALSVVAREQLRVVPFRSSDPEAGFGYEDWDWNCLAVGAGMIHKVVPGTWHFIRLKGAGSRNRMAQARDLLMRPSAVFDRLEHASIDGPGADIKVLGSHDAISDQSGQGECDQRVRVLRVPGLVAEWAALAAIEPELFPTADGLSRYKFWQPAQPEIGVVFGALLRQWGPAPTHVVLCDCFDAEGGGRYAANLVQSLLDDSADVVVIADRFGSSRLHFGGAGSLRTIAYEALARDLGQYWRVRLLAQALIQRPPHAVHVIDSPVGFEVLSAYARAVSTVSRLLVGVKSIGQAPDGAYSGLAVRHIGRIVDNISGLFSSSRGVLDWYCDIYGFPRDRCWLIPYAVKPGLQFRAPQRVLPEGRPRALWIGDGTRQSCPSLLLGIATLMPDWDFAVVAENDRSPPLPPDLAPLFSAVPNVATLSLGTGVSEAMRGAQALLYTNLLDGVPELFIDATVWGLPIIAADRPGLREFLTDATGYPVADFSQPEAYVARLRHVQENPGNAARRVERAQRRVKKDHCWRRFRQALESVYGHIGLPSTSRLTSPP
jgi:hypothetical protein